jgi:membrane protein required for colicin V production
LTLDLAVLAILAAAALYGAATGALRQLVSLAAAGLGVLAARAFSPAVAAGLARTVSPYVRHVAPVLLFAGVFALASLAGQLVLRASGLARAVRGPADRGAGALLGGAKGLLAAWLLLSALVLAGDLAPDALLRRTRGSDFAALARAHNLVRTLDPDAARTLERALRAARQAERAGRLARDPESARLLGDPRIRALEQGAPGSALDPDRSARLLEDPEIRALAERLAGRAAPPPDGAPPPAARPPPGRR